jgi:hypothetical protein
LVNQSFPRTPFVLIGYIGKRLDLIRSRGQINRSTLIEPQSSPVYVFSVVSPLQAIRDRYGNTVTITHANGQSGNITQVTSPNGR